MQLKVTCKDGMVIIRENIMTAKPVDVIVTFLEEVNAPVEDKLDLNKLSFKKARKLLAKCDESLSDIIIEERMSAV